MLIVGSLRNHDSNGNVISNLSLCSRLFFVIVSTVINKVNDLRILRDSLVKYNSFFNRRCPRRRHCGVVNSLLTYEGHASIVNKREDNSFMMDVSKYFDNSQLLE